MTFQELLSKTLEKLNNIEIKSTITITLILHYFWLIIFPRKSFETFLAKNKREIIGTLISSSPEDAFLIGTLVHYFTSKI